MYDSAAEAVRLHQTSEPKAAIAATSAAVMVAASPKGLEAIGPRRYGFDFDYVPLEEIQKTRPKFGTN